MSVHIKAQSTQPGLPAPNTMAQETILFLCPYNFSIRNVVHSNLLPNLQKHGLRSHILHRGSGVLPSRSDTEAEEAFRYGELLAPPKKGSQHWLRVLDVFQRASFSQRHNLTVDSITRAWYQLHVPIWKRVPFAVLAACSVIGRMSPFYDWQIGLMERLQRQTWDLVPAYHQLKTIQPSLVVAASCIEPIEEPFLLAARDLGIPTLGCVQSFDNPTCRSWLSPCNYYTVWNQRMKDQMMKYHGVDESRIVITGTAQFDFHRQETFRWSRNATLECLGLQPQDHYILYAANTYINTPTEPDLVLELARRCAHTSELRAHRVVVRLHPNDNFSRWNQLEERDPRIVVSRPSVQKYAFSSPRDQALLVSTLLHADVCHNMWSSMSLDAAVVNTPVVCVAFASQPGGSEDRYYQKVYETDFYHPIAESGGVRLARSMNHLVAETVAYVVDRSRDQDARLHMADQECGPLDGRNTERIADLIASLVARQQPTHITAEPQL